MPKEKKLSPIHHMQRKGAEGFDSYYASVYGPRWAPLRESLLMPVRQVARINGFADESWQGRLGEGSKIVSFAGFRAVVVESLPERLEPRADSSGLMDFYFMDPASIVAAAALGVEEGLDVLDLCAAPGGKSLLLAEGIGESGNLVCNEMSDRRRGRLSAVLHDYLPRAVLERVKVSGHDGARWCLYQKSAFDRVLVDAPCSGERHLLADQEEMKLWSTARSKNLAVRQYALLASALAVVRPGGRVVYSTCSISPLENDAVVARLLKKRGGELKISKPNFEIGEPTDLGWMILPDRTGFGPIYFSIIERQNGSEHQ
jgi:5-methylcytosine rRNA methyltransferase NSUN4